MNSDYVVVDLGCGLGGWSKGFIEKGFEVHGYDIQDFSDHYPGIFHQVDLMEAPLSIFPEADVVLASSPCTEFSKASMPRSWHPVVHVEEAIDMFNRFRDIALALKPEFYVLENVRGAQKFVGRADFHIGSRYFWTNVPPFKLVADDIYGKWKLPPSRDRAALRSLIPLSISRAFAQRIYAMLGQKSVESVR